MKDSQSTSALFVSSRIPNSFPAFAEEVPASIVGYSLEPRPPSDPPKGFGFETSCVSDYWFQPLSYHCTAGWSSTVAVTLYDCKLLPILAL